MSKHNKPINQHLRPIARTSDLSITQVGDETVVYDQLNHDASCLNAVTTAVWNACDGNSGNESLLQVLRQAGFQDANEDVVSLALEQLQQAGLLEGSAESVDAYTGMNRRELLRTIGKGAVMAVPVVSTIAIQSAAVATSCVDPGSCSNEGFDASCCSTSCSGGTCVPV